MKLEKGTRAIFTAYYQGEAARGVGVVQSNLGTRVLLETKDGPRKRVVMSRSEHVYPLAQAIPQGADPDRLVGRQVRETGCWEIGIFWPQDSPLTQIHTPSLDLIVQGVSDQDLDGVYLYLWQRLRNGH